MLRALCLALLSFARGSRGAAGIELALGAVALLGVSALCFDLYARVEADTAVSRVAVTMADYVSRDAVPDGGEMAALGAFLHEHELGVPANLAFVVTALRQPAGDPRPAVEVLWSDDSVRIGDAAATAALAGGCARHATAADLPADFTMNAGEVLVIAEVCARLTREGSLTGRFVAGDIHRAHALPARDPSEPPAAPARPVAQSTAGSGAAPRRRPAAATAGLATGPRGGTATSGPPAAPFTGPGATA